MKSKVYFWDMASTARVSFKQKMRRVLKKTGLGTIVASKDLTAIKLHFGENGNTTFLSPLLLKPVVDFLLKNGAKPFLTDTGTLYPGERGNAVQHAMLAAKHGFDPLLIKAPVIIADGLIGENQTEINADGNIFKRFYLASAITRANSMVTVSHFKGHQMAGFGGTLKNMAMGCASKQGKLAQHSGSCPVIDSQKCTGCAACLNYCAHQAISISEKKAVLDQLKCTGCGYCLGICTERALSVDWTGGSWEFIPRMAEYAWAVGNLFKKRMVHINILQNITPGCDCLSYSAPAICPDIGLLASTDPVALDQASYDLVNKQVGLGMCRNMTSGDDKFKVISPKIDALAIIEICQDLGLGNREYEIEHA